MGYEVNTPVFDGPFDLLLHLILKEEVDIHEVSLLGIVEAYLAEVQKMQILDWMWPLNFCSLLPRSSN